MPKGIPNQERRSLPRLTGEERSSVGKQMREQYDQGMSIRQIASKYGRSIGGTRRLLEENGVVYRGRGGANRATSA
ncbi:MAG: helix-turn-helix domain-containing protein [Frankiaceae bacterium]